MHRRQIFCVQRGQAKFPLRYSQYNPAQHSLAARAAGPEIAHRVESSLRACASPNPDASIHIVGVVMMRPKGPFCFFHFIFLANAMRIVCAKIGHPMVEGELEGELMALH